MTRIRQVKTTFTAGEVSRRLLGRSDLRAYENGALKLRNVFIQPTGGVTRRAGMRYIETAGGNGRLIAFEFSTEQTYLLALSAGMISIYADGVLVTALPAPWVEAQIAHIAWTQSADTLLLVHPDVPPQILGRQADGAWSLSEWRFFTKDNVIYQPYFKFTNTESTITPSGVSGIISLTASEAVFKEGHVGTRLRVGGKELEIISFDSPTVLTANVIEDLLSTDATIDWAEQAFSNVRGYPVSAAFHQDRLVVGGSRDLPNRLWFSKSGDLFNFDLGSGLDDEAIEFSVLSDQVNAIRGIFSGRHLQVFTSGAEWMVTGDPLTPVNVQIRRQTRVGSVTERYVPPVNVDGGTLFVARNGEQVQEFLYTDIEQAYQTSDLALVSRHIVPVPVDHDFDQRRRILFLVRDDGKLATLTIFRSEGVAAWSLHETSGQVKSVAVVGGNVFLLVRRNGIFTIEEFDDDLYLDAALAGQSEAPSLIWSGLDHLNGQTVSIVADGTVQDDQVVSGGQITLKSPASNVIAGLPYTHVIEPLPPGATGSSGSGRATRLIRALFRLEQTALLRLDVGRGLKDIALRSFSGAALLDAPVPLVSRDVWVRALGWQADGTKPLWRIEQDLPLPFTLLAVTTELKVND